MNYCANPFFWRRRVTREVKVGHVGVGGDNPIRVQTMLIRDTMNTEACVKEAIPIIEAGCEILRITAPSINDAKNLKNIVGELRKSLADCDEVIKRNPYHFGALAGYAQIYYRLENYDRALEYSRRALAVNPNMENVRQNMLLLERLLEERRKQMI